jgi:hypothetical protein
VRDTLKKELLIEKAGTIKVAHIPLDDAPCIKMRTLTVSEIGGARQIIGKPVDTSSVCVYPVLR